MSNTYTTGVAFVLNGELIQKAFYSSPPLAGDYVEIGGVEYEIVRRVYPASTKLLKSNDLITAHLKLISSN